MVLLMTPEVYNPFVAEVFTSALYFGDDVVNVRFFYCRHEKATHGTFTPLSVQQRLFLF